MTDRVLHLPTFGHFGESVRSFWEEVVLFGHSLAQGMRMAHTYSELSGMSDQELANRGLRRDQLADLITAMYRDG